MELTLNKFSSVVGVLTDRLLSDIGVNQLLNSHEADVAEKFPELVQMERFLKYGTAG